MTTLLYSRRAVALGAATWCLSAGAAAQGPIDGYLKARGETTLALSASATGADRFIGGDGATAFDFPFRGQLVGLYASYGLTDGLDLVASVPYVITETTAGLQDAALFAKGLLRRFPLGDAAHGARTLDVLGALGVSYPLSDYEVVAAGAIGQRAQVVQPRLVAQYNQPGFFASGIAGYNYRFDELDRERLAAIQRVRPGYRPDQPSDFLNFLLRAGVPTARLYADAWLEVQRTLGGSDFVPDVEELPQPYDVDYQQVGGTLYYSETGRWGFSVSGATFLGGRNTSRLWRVTAGAVLNLPAGRANR